MKKVIQCKVYDTETAIFIGTWSGGSPVDNPSRYSETLYRKRTGEFFIHGEGGALSRHATQCYGASKGGGEWILPIAVKEAFAWAKEHITGDRLETLFGTEKMGSADRIYVGGWLAASTANRIRLLAQERATSQVAIVQELLDKALSQD